MKFISFFSAALLLSSIAVASHPIEDPHPIGTDAEWLQYDSGTPAWFNWEGTQKGVWFNTEDFYPASDSTLIHQSQLWFYHSTSYPWDTSLTLVEIWTGEVSGPITRLNQTEITALHYAPVYANYDPPLSTGTEFWCLANSEMSSGGWPSLLSDNSSTVVHSFSGDSWAFTLHEYGEYLIRTYCDVSLSPLSRTSWGELKTLF